MKAKLWKLEKNIERIYQLALLMNIEALKMGKNGHGMSVAADETRTLSLVLEQLVEGYYFSDKKEDFEKNIISQADNIELLALNAFLENYRASYEHESNTMKVIIDELRKLGNAIKNIFLSDPDEKNSAVRLIGLKSYSDLPSQRSFFISFNVGKSEFLEDIHIITEILSYNNCKDYFEENILNIRDRKIPCVVLSDSLNTGDTGYDSDKRILIIDFFSGADSQDIQYLGLVADSVNGIFKFRHGKDEYENKLCDMNTKFIRKYWELKNNKSVYFLDWHELAE